MAKDVEEYVFTCNACQRKAIHHHKPYGQLESLPIPSQPFKTLTMDFITKLPPSKWQGQVYNSILVIMCAKSKWARYLPTHKNMFAEQFTELFLNQIIELIEMPKNMVTDHTDIFAQSKYWSTFCYYLKVWRHLLTAFHPQTDGQTEHQNQFLESYLHSYINFLQNDWAAWLLLVQFAYNNSTHSSLNMSLQKTLMRFWLSLCMDLNAEPFCGEASTTAEHVVNMKKIRKMLDQNVWRAQKQQKHYYDKRHKPMSFKIGQWVMVQAKNISITHTSSKLDYKQFELFKIIDAWSQQAYKLCLMPQYCNIHSVFHVLLLKPYHARDGQNLDSEVEPELINGEVEWEVEKILDQRLYYNKPQYLVHWKGYSLAEESWEPPEHLVNAQEALQDFKNKNPGPPQWRVKRRGR
jgi:hypothetical protein